MKKTIILTIILLSASRIFADPQADQQKVSLGNHYYEAKDYAAAVETYESVLAHGYCSAQLYYNLGNAYFRQDLLGQAVLSYERALRLRPNDREIQENLDLANSRIQDQIAVIPHLFVVRVWDGVVRFFSPDGWRIAILVLVSLLCIMVGVFFFADSYEWRRRSFVFGILVSVILVFSAASLITATHHHQEAVVTAASAIVKSSPEEGGVDKLVLHAGTKMDVKETIREWHKIRLSDGTTGWIPDSSIEII